MTAELSLAQDAL